MPNTDMDALEALITKNIKSLSLPLSTQGLPLCPSRLLNGRGGCAPGFDNVNIDLYPPLLFVTLYSKYSDPEVNSLVQKLMSMFEGFPLLVQDRSVRPADTRFLSEDAHGEIIVEEAGLRYYLHPGRGQNPGFFPDMRRGRELIRSIIQENLEKSGCKQSVLNLFAYTCSLSVASLSAGASKVVNIDKNKRSLDIGRRNHRLNDGFFSGTSAGNTIYLPHDIFKSIGRLKREGPYNLIIADPPPTQKGSFMMLKDYPRLLRRLPEMLVDGGILMLTQNGPSWSWNDFEKMIRENLPEFTALTKVQPPQDFAPAIDGRGLKIITARKPAG
ncbi:MAG: class I SAM-dependent methyltransferase [Spirochaetales bacterium]|uniref:Class I SAM-dependent methyltransferase n=1 Tax=Candidatus Thalassospirochaeta sargassi TaxID=3119039 RepID=A0AAJ1MHW3_9SPIO|nr:class I SAM-dependent methyltransferase [Spirochaetales bacterium]